MGSRSTQNDGHETDPTMIAEKTATKTGRQTIANGGKRNGEIISGSRSSVQRLSGPLDEFSAITTAAGKDNVRNISEQPTTDDIHVKDYPGPAFLTQFGTYKVRLQFKAPFLIITLLSFLTRFWRLDHPRSVVLDELVYGNFAAMYIKRQFFFDKGPVLGKQLIALLSYVAGYDGLDRYEAVGDPYRPTTPLWHMRFLPALCGSLTPPLAYQLVKALGYSEFAAMFAGLLLVFDTAFLTVSRFILLDAMVICLSVAAVLCAVKLIRLPLGLPTPSSLNVSEKLPKDTRNSSTESTGNSPVLWRDRLKWSFLLSVCLSLVINIKYAGFSVLLFVAVLLAFDYCSLLNRRDISYKFFTRYLMLLMGAVFVLPFVVHTASWAAHVLILNHAGGTNDNVMSVRYQASLEGGLNFLAQNQPYNISYGSQITLRSVQGAADGSGRPCWLHSHADLWPLRYADERGSSHQQQVTCYTHKDANNFWILKHAERETLHVENPAEFVKDNDIIQLVHGLTGRLLNSHDVAAPVTPDCQEVSCYVDYNIGMKAEPNWRVHLLQKFEGDEQWHPLVHQIQLVHETSGLVLSVTGKSLPEVAFSQGEVAVSRQLQAQGSIWFVEEHRYIEERSIKDDHERRLEVLKMDILPTEPQHMSFWDKLYECMYKLIMSRKESAEDHLYSSSPFKWLTMTRGVAFWVSPTSGAQIFLIGNVVVWYGAALSVFAALAAVAGGAALLQFKTCGQISTPPSLERLLLAVRVLVGAYLATFVPHLVADNSLFVTQYLQSLVFAVILAGVLCEELACILWKQSSAFGRVSDKRFMLIFGAFVAFWLSLVVWVWFKMVGFSYGLHAFDAQELHQLEWKETWDFIKR